MKAERYCTSISVLYPIRIGWLSYLGQIMNKSDVFFFPQREDPPKVCLNLTPLQSVVGKEVYARVDLIVQYTKHYPNK